MDDEPLTAFEHFQRALEMLQTGEYEVALTHIDAAIAQFYAGPERHMVRGEILFELQRHDEAIVAFDAAVTEDPSLLDDSTIWRARCFFEMQQFGRALSALNRVIARSAAPAEAYFIKGMVLVERGDALKGIEALSEARGLVGDQDDRIADILYWEGRAYQKLNRVEEAAAAYERAISTEPDYVEAYAELGELYRSQGRLEQACEVYRRGLRHHPGDPALCNDYGNALRDLGRLAESLESLTIAVEGDESRSMALFNRAITLERMGRWEDALRDYARVIAANPSDVESRLRRVEIFSRLDRFADAWAEYEVLTEEERVSADAADKLARLLNRQARVHEAAGDYSEALTCHGKVLAVHPELIDFDNPGKQFASARDRQQRALTGFATVPPEHPDAGLLPLLRALLCLRLEDRDGLRAELPAAMQGPYPEFALFLAADSQYHDHNDPTAAMASLAKAIEMRPDFIRALWLRAMIQLTGLRDSHGAVKTYLEMLKLSPGNPTVLGELGELYLALGEPWRALACFRELQETAPADPAVRREVALCYLGLGRIGEAVEELRRLVIQSEAQLDNKLCLVEALLRAGELSEAADLLADIEQVNGGIDPGVTDSCRELRSALLNRQGRHAQAIELLLAVPEEELSELGLLELGTALSREGRNPEATTKLEQLVAETTAVQWEGQRARIELAKCVREDGDFQRARGLVAEVVEANPFNHRAWAMLYWFHRESGELEQAEVAEQSAAIFADLEPGHRLLLQEEWEDAAADLVDVAKRHEESSAAHYYLAAAYHRAGMHEVAASTLQRAVLISPNLIQRIRMDPLFDGFSISELAEPVTHGEN